MITVSPVDLEQALGLIFGAYAVVWVAIRIIRTGLRS